MVVNEAGASVYSTSQIGREELPRYDATVRGAVSIGRRAIDPLSELVKIDPASIGVGLVSARRQGQAPADVVGRGRGKLRELRRRRSEFGQPGAVGLRLGTQSADRPTGLRVSPTARSFQRREQLKDVPGIGEATYVQAAGFLKIVDGENPLDATWIHPESYDIARRVLAEIDCDLSQLIELLKNRKPTATADAPTGGTRPTAASVGRGPRACRSSDVGGPRGACGCVSESASMDESPAHRRGPDGRGAPDGGHGNGSEPRRRRENGGVGGHNRGRRPRRRRDGGGDGNGPRVIGAWRKLRRRPRCRSGWRKSTSRPWPRNLASASSHCVTSSPPWLGPVAIPARICCRRCSAARS